MTKIEKALNAFDEGFNCSQALLSSYAEQFGLDRDSALKIATPFGGGLARTGGTCGAVTGALMVIGLMYGQNDSEDKQAAEKSYQLSVQLMQQISNRFGSTTCKAMLGEDISTEEGLARARERQLFQTLCRDYITYIIQCLEKLL